MHFQMVITNSSRAHSKYMKLPQLQETVLTFSLERLCVHVRTICMDFMSHVSEPTQISCSNHKNKQVHFQ